MRRCCYCDRGGDGAGGVCGAFDGDGGRERAKEGDVDDEVCGCVEAEG